MNDEEQQQTPTDALEIGSEEYKLICTLTLEECNEISCRSCPEAIKYYQQQKAEEKEYDHKKYTIFEKEAAAFGLTIKRNDADTIARIGAAAFEEQTKAGDDTGREYLSSTIIPYDPAKLKQYPELFKLKTHNSFGVPDEIRADKDRVAVVRWGDVVYLIAPQTEGDE